MSTTSRLLLRVLVLSLLLLHTEQFAPLNRVRRKHRVIAALSSNEQAIVKEAAAVAERAARRAGEEIKAGMGSEIKKQKFNFKDIVTEVDGRCQELIRQDIKDAFPDHSFLGEEDVPPGPVEAAAAVERVALDAEWCWIVDPVDGTTNLAAGIPLVTTSIALTRRGVIEMGCVYDPNRDELFLARRGCGATLNGRPMKNTAAAEQQQQQQQGAALGELKSSPLKDVVMCVGNPPEPTAFHHNIEVIRTIGPQVRGVRMLSSAALIYCWVALGRVNTYVATAINAWDFAAGKLIVEECGGVTSDHHGTTLLLSHRDTICSSSPLIHSSILAAMPENAK